ncbi:MAG: hypothetical protein RLY71_4669 [Pseudomonadota bacterium]|jgi:outer membrane protein
MKKLCLALLAAAAFVPAAQAAPAAGDILVRARLVNIDPADKDTVVLPASLGGDVNVTVNSKVIPEVDFTYFVTSNVAAELILTYPQKHDVKVNGDKIGTLKHLPPTLTAQYHFTDFGAIKPYVGAGINLTLFSGVDLPLTLEIDKSSVGLALQAGVDYAIDKTWSLNFDVKKVQIRTDLKHPTLGNLGTIKVDPLLVGVGVGMKF